MVSGTAPDETVVGEILNEWRHQATNTLLATIALACLPVIPLVCLGLGPAFTPLMNALLVATYAVVVAGALLRRTNHEVRLWAMLAAAYFLSLIGAVAVPYGPFVRSLPFSLAIVPLLFIGARAGRIATALSAAIFLLSPLLHNVPGLARAVAASPGDAPVPMDLTVVQSVALTMTLVPLMHVMERFHQFLIQSLTAAHRSAVERAAAYQTLEREMNERRRLQREMIRMGVEERRSLGQEMHDGVCQQLTGAALRCQAIKRRLERREDLVAEDVTALACLIDEAIEEAYVVARGLNPLEPEPGALVHALRILVARTKATVPCELRATGDVHIDDPAVAHHLYRFAQEALSNAVRHAHASRILVELHGDEESMVLRIRDDGTGLPDELPTGGMGFRTMASRAHAIDGVLSVERPSQGGTGILCRVPRGNGLRAVNGPHEVKEATLDAA